MDKTVATETAALGLTPFKTCTTLRELVYSRSGIPETIPVGKSVALYWSTEEPGKVYFDYEGRMRWVRTEVMFNTFSGRFLRTPSVSTLERWSNGGTCKTVTGHVTEPDGTGTDGSPSWLLILGMI